jgi:asparaginyl-tRNA synthetase
MGGDRWPSVTYTQAVELLEEAVSSNIATFSFPPSWSAGLQLEHEKFIVDSVGNGRPVFVTDYPKEVKPFYMSPSASKAANGRETVACFDLLMPEISEVAGGSLREHRLPSLVQNMREHDLIKARCFPTSATSSSASYPSESDPAATPSDSSSSYPYLEPHEDLGALRWYADLRRWGSAPHGGFGLGFDRFLGYLTGVASIRDVVPFPRYFGKADC